MPRSDNLVPRPVGIFVWRRTQRSGAERVQGRTEQRRHIRRARVGLNLQRLRRNKGLSQEELAARADMHQTRLSGVERGVRNASVLVLARIAKALGIDIEELFRRKR